MSDPKRPELDDDDTTQQLRKTDPLGRFWSEDAVTIIRKDESGQIIQPAVGRVFFLFRALEELNLPVLMALLIQQTQVNVRDFGRFTPDDPAALQKLREALEALFSRLGLLSARDALQERGLWPL